MTKAIELYQQSIERLIAQGSRQNGQQVCTYLATMHSFCAKLANLEALNGYMKSLLEQKRNLRALKEKRAHADL